MKIYGWDKMMKSMSAMKQWDKNSPQKAPRVQEKSCSITIASSGDMQNEERALSYKEDWTIKIKR